MLPELPLSDCFLKHFAPEFRPKCYETRAVNLSLNGAIFPFIWPMILLHRLSLSRLRVTSENSELLLRELVAHSSDHKELRVKKNNNKL